MYIYSTVSLLESTNLGGMTFSEVVLGMLDKYKFISES